MGCMCIREHEKHSITTAEKSKIEAEVADKKQLPPSPKQSRPKSYREPNCEAAMARRYSLPNIGGRRRLSTAGNVHYLKKPLAVYYRLACDFQESPSKFITKAENLITKQPCLILYKPAHYRYGTQKSEERRHPWKLWSSLDHPHILRTYECLKDEKGEYWVFEDYNGGNAEEWLSREQGSIPESLVMRVMFQVFVALKYVHSRGIVVRNLDLKSLVFPQAVTDTSTKTKLGYFFHACELGGAKQLSESTRKSPFFSPEARSGYSGPECDLWSCGVLLHFLLSGCSPFPSVDDPSALESAMQQTVQLVSPRWESVSKEAKTLVLALLSPEKETRLAVADCLSSPCLLQYAQKHKLDSKGIRKAFPSASAAPSCSRIRQAVLYLILTRVVKKSSLTMLSDTFQALDTDFDGRISREELLVGMRKVYAESEAVRLTEESITFSDRDNSDSIDYSEFLLLTCCEEKLLSKANLKRVFLSFDRDGCGTIPLKELKDGIVMKQGKKGEAIWKEFMRGTDRFSDEEINFSEFQAMLKTAMQ